MPGGISIRKERMTVSSQNFLTDKDRFCIWKILIYRKNPGISRLRKSMILMLFIIYVRWHQPFFWEGRFLETGFFAQKKQRAVVFFNKTMKKEIGISIFIALRSQMTFWVSRIGFQILRCFFLQLLFLELRTKTIMNCCNTNNNKNGILKSCHWHSTLELLPSWAESYPNHFIKCAPTSL